MWRRKGKSLSRCDIPPPACGARILTPGATSVGFTLVCHPGISASGESGIRQQSGIIRSDSITRWAWTVSSASFPVSVHRNALPPRSPARPAATYHHCPAQFSSESDGWSDSAVQVTIQGRKSDRSPARGCTGSVHRNRTGPVCRGNSARCAFLRCRIRQGEAPGCTGQCHFVFILFPDHRRWRLLVCTHPQLNIPHGASTNCPDVCPPSAASFPVPTLMTFRPTPDAASRYVSISQIPRCEIRMHFKTKVDGQRPTVLHRPALSHNRRYIGSVVLGIHLPQVIRDLPRKQSAPRRHSPVDARLAVPFPRQSHNRSP